MLVAITGGIGSGKSLAAKLFSELGVDVLYADDIAKEIMTSNSVVKRSLIDYFGKNAYDRDNRLNKDLLRREIFNDESKRLWLNNLVHPYVWEYINNIANEEKNKYVLAEIPLLLESGNHDKVDKIVVVDCPVEQQIQRSCARDRQSIEEIEKIIATQINRMERLKMAHYILDNSTSIENLKDQVFKVHNELSNN